METNILRLIPTITNGITTVGLKLKKRFDGIQKYLYCLARFMTISYRFSGSTPVILHLYWGIAASDRRKRLKTF